jgi:hypothetical protein
MSCETCCQAPTTSVRVEWPQCRIDKGRERRPLRTRGGIGEDAKGPRKALDCVKQKGGSVGSPGRDLGDAANLEARVGALDAAQRPELLDKLDEFAQVLVHDVRPCRARRASA